MRGIRAWLVLCVLVAGCGFRSGLDESSFTLESFVVDQASYVQGEGGIATATFRNAGPRPASIPELAVNPSGMPEGAPDFTVSLLDEPEEIAPGDIGTIRWSFASSESADPRTVELKLKDPAGVGVGAVTFTLELAASLKVNALAFESAPTFGAEPIDYTCRGVTKAAFLVATVQNNGASGAILSNAFLRVDDGNANFESHGGDGNPVTLAPGAIGTFHMSIQALAAAEPGNDYVVSWLATYTDATTGHPRETGAAHEPVFLTVHIPATLELTVEEAATMLTTGAPDAGVVQISYVNTGTVPARIDSSQLTMQIAATATTTEYSIATPNGSFPRTVAAETGGEVVYPTVTLTSGTPTTGETEVSGKLFITDLVCEQSSDPAAPEASRGLWSVQ